MCHSNNVFWCWNVQSNESRTESMLAMDLLDEYGYVCIIRSRMYVRVDALININIIMVQVDAAVQG